MASFRTQAEIEAEVRSLVGGQSTATSRSMTPADMAAAMNQAYLSMQNGMEKYDRYFMTRRFTFAVTASGNTSSVTCTTNGTTTLTSSAAFSANNVGSAITGTGIPANTIITAYVSASEVTMSAASTVSSTEARTLAPAQGVYVAGGTVLTPKNIRDIIRVFDRTYFVNYNKMPRDTGWNGATGFFGDVKAWSFDKSAALTSGFDAVAGDDTIGAYELAFLSPPLGVPYVGSLADVTYSYYPTVVTTTTLATTTVAVGTTSGLQTVTSAALFTASDVGKSITGTGIPDGATISAFASTSSITISAAATATGSITATLGNVVEMERSYYPIFVKLTALHLLMARPAEFQTRGPVILQMLAAEPLPGTPGMVFGKTGIFDAMKSQFIQPPKDNKVV